MRSMLSRIGRRQVAVLGLVMLTIALGATPTRAVTLDTDSYYVDIDGSVSSGSPGADGVYAGDADATVFVVLTNATVTNTLGSANVTVPASIVVGTVDGVAFGGGSTVELRDIGLAPGASRTYTLTVNVQLCLTSPAQEFGVVAKPTSDFSGTGNELVLAEGLSDRLLDVVGNCGLAFVAQPTSAVRTQTITTVPFDPSAAAISVELRDAGDTGRATVSGPVVTLSASRPGVPLAPGLSGTTAVAAADGLATFSPGPTLSVSAFKYRFEASSPGLTTSPTSNPFDIVDSRADCPVGTNCSASSSKGTIAVTAGLAGGPGAGDLLLALDAADAPNFECADYPKLGGDVVSEYRFESSADRTVTLTYVVTNGPRPLKDSLVCWAAPYPFMTMKHTTSDVQGTKPGTSDPLYVGVLPFCANKNPQLPCILKRTMDAKTKAITLSVLATSEDPWRY